MFAHALSIYLFFHLSKSIHLGNLHRLHKLTRDSDWIWLVTGVMPTMTVSCSLSRDHSILRSTYPCKISVFQYLLWADLFWCERCVFAQGLSHGLTPNEPWRKKEKELVFMAVMLTQSRKYATDWMYLPVLENDRWASKMAYSTKLFVPGSQNPPVWVVEIVGEKPWHRRLMARSFDLFYPLCLPKWFWPDWACWQARWKMAGKWHSQLIAGTGLSSPVDFLTFFSVFYVTGTPMNQLGFRCQACPPSDEFWVPMVSGRYSWVSTGHWKLAFIDQLPCVYVQRCTQYTCMSTYNSTMFTHTHTHTHIYIYTNRCYNYGRM